MNAHDLTAILIAIPFGLVALAGSVAPWIGLAILAKWVLRW